MTTHEAADRLQKFYTAAAKIGVSVECLATATPGAPYSLIKRSLALGEIEAMIAGIDYLSGLYDGGNLEQLQRSLQIALFEKQGKKWKQRKK